MTSPLDAALLSVIRRDRLVVTIALLSIILLSWLYLLSGAGMEMMRLAVWTPGYAVLTFFMWWIMMVAMMLPSAAPMIILFTTINRKQSEAGHPYVETSVFVLGYLVTWAGFSLVAVVLQWVLERTGFLSPMLVGSSRIFGAILLLTAGAYQLTPVKHACLRHCRSPLEFLMTHWQPGARGALRMGLVHGAFCVGCCWFLMGLLFVGGVMNLYWIAGLALFVLFEKTVPAGHALGYMSGIALLIGGGWMLVSAL